MSFISTQVRGEARHFNTLRHDDAYICQRAWPSSIQAMACACSAQSHYLNKWSLVIIRTLRSQLPSNLNTDTVTIAFKKMIWKCLQKGPFTLSRPQCINMFRLGVHIADWKAYHTAVGPHVALWGATSLMADENRCDVIQDVGRKYHLKATQGAKSLPNYTRKCTRKCKNVFPFPFICQHCDGRGSWKPTTCKLQTSLFCIANNTTVEDLATEGAKSSAAMVWASSIEIAQS